MGVVKLNNRSGKWAGDWDSKTPTLSAEDTTLPGSPNVNLTTPDGGFESGLLQRRVSQPLAAQDSELGLGHGPFARWHDPLFL